MKTLEDFKQEVAEKYGSENFVSLYHKASVLRQLPNVVTIFDQAAELYAEYKAKEAWNEAIEEASSIPCLHEDRKLIYDLKRT